MKSLTKSIQATALACLGTFYGTSASAKVLDFEDAANLGLSISSNIAWSGIGGGHLYFGNTLDDDFTLFTSSTYINSFQLNAKAWQGFTNPNEHIGSLDISGIDASKQTIWQTTVDLSNYTDWNNWLTVNVETANITQLTFFAPGRLPHLNGFWPSLDNMVINEQVPVPAAVWLFGSGLLALTGLASRRRCTG